VRRSGIIAINLKKGDKLVGVRLSSGKDDVIIGTRKGLAIRFKESGVRPMSRATAGVKGITLRSGDAVSSFDVISEGKSGDAMFLNILEKGFAKQTSLKEYKTQTRGGKGIITAVVTAKTGELVSSKVVSGEQELVTISEKGQILKTRLTP
jgi:DNA gyrase subunit A